MRSRKQKKADKKYWDTVALIDTILDEGINGDIITRSIAFKAVATLITAQERTRNDTTKKPPKKSR